MARILPELVAEAGRVTPQAWVLVVDNDPDGGAADYVLSLAGAHPASRIRYVHEPTPGIAAARNRALDEARTAGARALVFIDDDEEPTDGWLTALTTTWAQHGAAAVTGPVEPVFEAQPSEWVLASRRFARRRHISGKTLRSASSNNLLLDLDVIERLGLRFDVSFGLTGGEDTLFTHELVARGGLIVWDESAVVRDHIPTARMTRSWILRREFRSGTSYARMRLTRTSGPIRSGVLRTDLATRGLVRAVAASARWAWGALTHNVEHQARGACRAAANAGLVSGAFGVRYREYRRAP